MRKILLILPLFLFASCISTGGGYISFDKSEFYEIKVGDDDSYFVSYPQSGVIEEDDGVLTMDYSNCSVEFGEGLDYELDSDDLIDIKTYEKNNVFYQAWYKDNLLVRYGGGLNNYDYNFWLSDEENGVSDCVLILETMAESFTDTPFYYNKDYGFKVDLLPTFQMEYLPSGEGILMKKWVEDGVCIDEWEQEFQCGYKVEIYVFGTENVMEYQNLAEFLADKYSGYSVEFAGSGVFVDEGSGENAIRHYFMMNEGADVVYEAYLEVPSIYYSAHKGGFDEFVESFEIL